MRTVRLLIASSLCLALALAVGCTEEEDFESCPFDPCLYAQCAAEQTGKEGTEIVYSCAAQHPQCAEGVCLRYEGSGAFCTSVCSSDAECPGNSRCLPEVSEENVVRHCVPSVEERPEPPADPEPCGKFCDPNATDPCDEGWRCAEFRPDVPSESHHCVPTVTSGE